MTAAVDASGATRTIYLSDEAFVTEPTDTPANTAFLPRLLNAGRIGLSIFSSGKVGGATKLETGEIVVANLDGALDEMAGWGFDGRPVVIRSGATGRYPQDFPVIMTGTIETVDPDWDHLVFRLRDKQFVLDRQVADLKYAGDNVLPAGLEGTAADLKDKPKPRAFGVCPNVQPKIVNTTRLVGQVNVGPVADIKVYDRGKLLTFGADRATSIDLFAATIAPGSYDTCLAEGLFRLGFKPAGVVTADVIEGADPEDRTAAAILARLMILAGLPAAEVSSADLEALAAANAAPVGIYVDNEDTFRTVVDRIAGSVGAYSIPDALGVMRFGILEPPVGAPLLTLYDYDLGREVQVKPSASGLPVWSLTVRHTKLGVVQASDLAGEVDDDRRAYLALEYRSAKAEAPEVKAKHLLAREMTVDTLLTDAEEAEEEAQRLLAIHSVGRMQFEVSAPADLVARSGVWLGKEVALDLPRFGLAGGRSFRVIGLRLDLGKRRIFLTLWG